MELVEALEVRDDDRAVRVRQSAQAVERGRGGGGPVEELAVHGAVAEKERLAVSVNGSLDDSLRRRPGEVEAGVFVRRAAGLVWTHLPS